MSDRHPRRQRTRMQPRPRGGATGGRGLRAGAIVVLAAVLAAAAAMLLPAAASAGPAAAAAPVAAGLQQAATPQQAAAAVPALPRWTANNNLELSVTPTSRLSPNGAEITVRGSGYDADGELWIAVCQDDGVAPEQFAHCLGGAIPTANSSTAWAVVTADGKARYAGPVNAKFGGRGQFKVTMQIPVASGQDADCINGSCSVYTRSADPADRSQDASVGIRFSQPRPSSETAPSTEVIGGAGTTVDPDSVASEQLSPGEQQTVVFSSFTPQEPVDVTLYSDPIALPAVKANGSGVVTISFDVPADLPLGEHLVQAVGRTSGVVGVAAFSVVEPLVTTTDTTTGTETATGTADSTAATSSPEETETLSEAPIAPIAPDETDQLMTTLGDADETSTSPEPPATATDDVAATQPADGAAESSGNRLLWLWIMLAALVVIGGAAAAVALTRRRRSLIGGGPAGYDGAPGVAPEPEPAPSWEDLRAQAPAAEVQWPLYGGDPLAAPAAAEPAGQMPGGLDQLFGAVAAPAPAAADDDGGPATEQFRPVFHDTDHDADHDADHGAGQVAGQAVRQAAGHDDGGPATEQFRPVFHDDPALGLASGETGPVGPGLAHTDEDAADAADYAGDDPGPRGGRHHRSD